MYRRAWEQHQRHRLEHLRQQQFNVEQQKRKRAQERVLWVNSLSHLRNVRRGVGTCGRRKCSLHFYFSSSYYGFLEVVGSTLGSRLLQ